MGLGGGGCWLVLPGGLRGVVSLGVGGVEGCGDEGGGLGGVDGMGGHGERGGGRTVCGEGGILVVEVVVVVVGVVVSVSVENRGRW